MNIFDGLEKFGLDVSGKVDLYGEDKKDAKNAKNAIKKPNPLLPLILRPMRETGFLLNRSR